MLTEELLENLPPSLFPTWQLHRARTPQTIILLKVRAAPSPGAGRNENKPIVLSVSLPSAWRTDRIYFPHRSLTKARSAVDFIISSYNNNQIFSIRGHSPVSPSMLQLLMDHESLGNISYNLLNLQCPFLAAAPLSAVPAPPIWDGLLQETLPSMSQSINLDYLHPI